MLGDGALARARRLSYCGHGQAQQALGIRARVKRVSGDCRCGSDGEGGALRSAELRYFVREVLDCVCRGCWAHVWELHGGGGVLEARCDGRRWREGAQVRGVQLEM